MQHHPEEFVLPFEKIEKIAHRYLLQIHFSKPMMTSSTIMKILCREEEREAGRDGWMQCYMLS